MHLWCGHARATDTNWYEAEPHYHHDEAILIRSHYIFI